MHAGGSKSGKRQCEKRQDDTGPPGEIPYRAGRQAGALQRGPQRPGPDAPLLSGVFVDNVKNQRTILYEGYFHFLLTIPPFGVKL